MMFTFFSFPLPTESSKFYKSPFVRVLGSNFSQPLPFLFNVSIRLPVFKTRISFSFATPLGLFTYLGARYWNLLPVLLPVRNFQVLFFYRIQGYIGVRAQNSSNPHSLLVSRARKLFKSRLSMSRTEHWQVNNNHFHFSPSIDTLLLCSTSSSSYRRSNFVS